MSNERYTTPTAAVTTMLESNDFDNLVINNGRVRLIIEGDFGTDGAAIFGMSLVRVQTQPPPRAVTSIDILRGLADATEAPSPKYVLAANAEQMRTLDAYANAVDGTAADVVQHVVSTALRIQRIGKPFVDCGVFMLPHEAPAVRVLVELLEAP